MGRRKVSKRAPIQARADESTAELAKKIGRSLRDARKGHRLTQVEAATRAGISQSEWSNLELGKKGSTLWVTNRAAFAVDGTLDAWIKGATSANLPRDAVHIKHENLLIRAARPGNWETLPEEALDRDIRHSRFGDVLLHRGRPGCPHEYCLCEIWDWFDDVGAAMRDFTRRLDALDRYAIAHMRPDDPVPQTAGFWLVRATRRNRQLIGDHGDLFRARFPGSGRAWLAGLANASAPLPKDAALLWVSVNSERLFAARLGGP